MGTFTPLFTGKRIDKIEGVFFFFKFVVIFFSGVEIKLNVKSFVFTAMHFI